MQAINERTPKRKHALEISQRKMEAGRFKSWKQGLRNTYKKLNEDFRKTREKMMHRKDKEKST